EWTFTVGSRTSTVDNPAFQAEKRLNPVNLHSPDSSGDEATESTDASLTKDGAVLTPEQLAEAQRYARLDLICDLTTRVVDLGFLVVLAFLLGGPNGWLMQHVPSAGTPETLRLSVLFLLIATLNMAIDFPFSFYGGFVLEHQFGMSQLSLGRWLWRYAKGQSLQLVFGLLLLVGLYWLIWTTGPWWWLTAAGAVFAVAIVAGQLMPVLIMPLFYKITRLDDAELAQRMQRLAEGTGLSIEGVYRMDLSKETVKANAMLAGLGPTRRVILGDTLLDNFTTDEIEVILAHEVGHHVHRHIYRMIVLGAVFCAAGFWACDAVLTLWIRATDPALITSGGSIDYTQFPVYALPMMMLVLSLFSTLLEPLTNAISRHHERQCDRYALNRTGKAEAYRTAFRKLARLNKDDPAPNSVAVMLFHSHPPISERLAMAEGAKS
ncbi:MAG: M48 family metallopeptidase, partial [Planctomycetes bacterium]|nr:M48 family metallopeptidase [Planctomycetota bacterium]